jgi:predicted ATPase
MISKNFKIVLTGGPGVGKTSILAQLKKLNYEVRSEVFTEVFGEAVRENRLNELFAKPSELLGDLIRRQRKIEFTTDQEGVTFFDRSHVDILAFAQTLQFSLSPDDLKELTQAQYDLVFLIEPLPSQFYDQNKIRRQDYAQSLQDHKLVADAYREFFRKQGSEPKEKIISVPQFGGVDVDESIRLRTTLILETVARKFKFN